MGRHGALLLAIMKKTTSLLGALRMLSFGTVAFAQVTYGPTVDLGYGVYTGVFNASTRLVVWKG